MFRMLCAFLAAGAFTGSASGAQDLPGFEAGAVIEEYGRVAPIDADFVPPAEQTLRAVFDVSKVVEEGENPHIDKVARLINMHGKNGLQPQPMDLVVVVHGRAVGDLVDEERNAQRGLVRALLENDVRFIVCGQSVVALGVDPELFLPGVEVALSAMTAHASLSGQGYVSMPF